MGELLRTIDLRQLRRADAAAAAKIRGVIAKPQFGIAAEVRAEVESDAGTLDSILGDKDIIQILIAGPASK